MIRNLQKDILLDTVQCHHKQFRIQNSYKKENSINVIHPLAWQGVNMSCLGVCSRQTEYKFSLVVRVYYLRLTNYEKKKIFRHCLGQCSPPFYVGEDLCLMLSMLN